MNRVSALLQLSVLLLLAACSDDGTGPGETAALGVMPTAAAPGAVIEITGLSAGQVSGPGLWIEVGGERTPLLDRGQGRIAAVVPTFLDPETLWPVPPEGEVEVTVRSETEVIATASESFRVLPLAPADGTVQGLLSSHAAIASALTEIADAIPPGAGETARFSYAISRGLDSLFHATHTGEASLAAAYAEFQAVPDELKLLDALVASSGLHRGPAELRVRLEGVASAMQTTSSTSTVAGSSATSIVGSSAPSSGADSIARPSVAAIVGPSAAASMGASTGASASATIEALDDLTLSRLMQLSFYLRENTELQAELGQDISTWFGLFSVFGVDLDKIGGKTPIGTIMSLLSAYQSMQALVLQTYVVAALPSRLDSLSLEISSDTLMPGERTEATVQVHASNQPDPVTLGELLSQLMSVAGLVQGKVDADKLDELSKWWLPTLNYLLGQGSTLLGEFAQIHPDFEYDTDLVDLWSVPQISFRAEVTNPRLLELRSGDATVVAPVEGALAWEAVADTSRSTTVGVSPSRPPEAPTIPILLEWFADYLSENSGDASELTLGSFGVDIVGSPNLPVSILAFDLTGTWALTVDGVCSGEIEIVQTGTEFEVSGSVGGGFCPFSASGAGSGGLDRDRITFGIAFGTGMDESGWDGGTINFDGTIEPDGNRMEGTYSGDRSGSWVAVR